ncbi:MAG: tetratricopeptide repeat protein, partial [Planctomycetales bacterium]|nr:tetratricopeptide repeat protein [Planctomycetales bacterium]
MRGLALAAGVGILSSLAVALPDEPDLDQAREDLRRGRYERAEKALARLAADTEAPPEARPLRVEALRMLGRLADAEAEAEKLVAAAPADAARAGLFVLRGDLRAARGKLDEAAADYQAARAADPTSLAAAAGLAEVRLARGALAEAEEVAAAAVAAAPEDAGAATAGALTSLGRAAEVLAEVSGVREGRPRGDPDMYLRANEFYQAAMRLDRAAGREAILRRGALFLLKHNPNQAKSFFQDLLRENPSDPDAQAGLASCHLTFPNGHPAARIHAQRALDVNPNHPRALLVLAALEAVAENYEEAAARCDRVIAVDPSNMEARAGRAACLLVLGRRAEFEAEKAAILAVRPDSNAAQKRRIVGRRGGRDAISRVELVQGG